MGITGAMLSQPIRSPHLHWAITFILLSVVTMGFAFVGTDGETVSLPICAVAMVFFGLAVAMVVIVPRLGENHPVQRSLRRVIRFLKA